MFDKAFSCRKTYLLRRFIVTKVLFYILIIVLGVYESISYAGQADIATVRKIADEYLKLVKNGNFRTAAKLFHYPKTYTNKQIVDDMNGVTKLIAIVTEEFGIILNEDITDTLPTVYSVLVESGYVRYWQRYPYSIKLTYEVDFGKEGRGYVIIDLCNIDDKWEIRQVKYGLPASRPDSRVRIMTIMKKMLQLMQESVK